MRIFCCFCALILPCAPALALTVEIKGALPGQLPEITYPAGNEPLLVTVDVRNELPTPSDPVLLWQLAFAAIPAENALGDLKFVGLNPPSMPLFGMDSQPLALGDLPAASVVATDIDPAFMGVPIDRETSVSVAELRVVASEGAAGSFLIAAVPFDADDVDHSSFWGNSNEELFGFANLIGQSGYIELAQVSISDSGISPIGDYNIDGFVDAADYTLWRDGLGGEFKVEHYETWRAHFGQSSSEIGLAIAMPEGASPAVLLLMILFGCPRSFYRPIKPFRS